MTVIAVGPRDARSYVDMTGFRLVLDGRARQ